jgi:hypothetical protein
MLFFEGVKQFAQPQLTRFVRADVGTGLRDGEEDVPGLLSSWLKHGLYQRFYEERGQDIKTTQMRNDQHKKEGW